MLKVAICDDSSMYSEKIETFVTRFGAANLVEVKTEVFTSGSQLMLYFGEKKFDLIFLHDGNIGSPYKGSQDLA